MASISAPISRICARWPPLSLVRIYALSINIGINFLRVGMKLSKAYAYLGDVKDHKRVIPFRRFSGGVGRASQAKEFKATQGALQCTLIVPYNINYSVSLGRWPEKSVKFISRLLKNAESNADAKGIDVEDLTIKNIVVQQAPVRHYVPFPRATCVLKALPR